jgi:hypothetical protein
MKLVCILQQMSRLPPEAARPTAVALMAHHVSDIIHQRIRNVSEVKTLIHNLDRAIVYLVSRLCLETQLITGLEPGNAFARFRLPMADAVGEAAYGRTPAPHLKGAQRDQFDRITLPVTA